MTTELERPGDDREHPVEVCEQLNFEHSLAREADELHRRVIDVFLDIAATREQVVAAWDRTANAALGPAEERCRALAAQSRANLVVTRRQTKRLMAAHRAAPRP